MYGYPQYTTPGVNYTQMRNGFNEQLFNGGQFPPIQQNFITPSNISEYDTRSVNSLDEVKSIFVSKDTIFINKANNEFYVRKMNGSLTRYKFEEIVDLDDKDLRIKELEEKLKKYESEVVSNDAESNTNA